MYYNNNSYQQISVSGHSFGSGAVGILPAEAGMNRAQSGKRELPRIQELSAAAKQSWQDVLTSHLNFFDTCIFMLYTIETTNTAFAHIEEILRSNPGCYVIACGETRMELENLASRAGDARAQLAQCGLYWYRRLRQEGLLFELAPFRSTSGAYNGYADPSVIIRMMSEMMLRRPGTKPFAFFARDNRLGEDALLINQMNSVRGCDPLKVLFVNPLAKVVPFVPRDQRVQAGMMRISV